MKILAFETSCDDTAIAIIEDGYKVLVNSRITQTEHEKWGGVVPEIAARLHSENWKKLLEDCLAETNLSIEDIDYIACTQGPGLQTSLLTGTTAASFLSLCFQKPLIPVHHIYGHICSGLLEQVASPQFPALVLTVSGGHTQMHLWQSFTDLNCLGSTLDDAAGEAFDKVAKMLGLGYPGGPIVSEMAENGDRLKYDLPKIYLAKDSLDFSFSGLKASVYRLIEVQNKTPLSETDFKTFQADVCASFEYAVGKIFCRKIERVLTQYPEIKSVYFVGGVSANIYLNKIISEFLSLKNISLHTPQKIAYSTDNAAMIGSAAYQLLQENPDIAKIQFIDADSRLLLTTTN